MRFHQLILAAASALTVTVTSASAQSPLPPPFGGSQNTYLCHNINGARALQYEAGVRDQFGETNFEILEAIKICNPILESKVVPPGEEGFEFPPSRSPQVHYICYRIRIGNTNALGKRFEVRNQLEEQDYRSDQPVELCIPTEKRH